MINRTFKTVPWHDNPSLTDVWDLDNLEAPGGLCWDDLYKWKRILIVSEAGAGKTHECKQQSSILYKMGKPSFYIDLSQLAHTTELSELIEEECSQTFDSWIKSQSEVATFFLDSLDELLFSNINLDTALRRFKSLIEYQYHKVQIVITTRPTRERLKVLETQLPVTKVPIPVNSRKEKLASTATKEVTGQENYSPRINSKDWSAVTLEPLTTSQIRQLASEKEVSNPGEFMNDITSCEIEDFLTRPLDVVNLINVWKNGDFSRELRMQVRGSIIRRLSPTNTERREPIELSEERAYEGAKKLALSMILLNKLTLRSFSNTDRTDNSEAIIEPSAILPDWTQTEIAALLQRPLFEFASPGCVKIHHQTILEFLGAEELKSLIESGLGISGLAQTLFSISESKYVIRSAMCGAMAAWLAYDNSRIYEILRDNEPELLMTSGDPESLSFEECRQVLLSYVKKYGNSNIRETTAQNSQLKRFATADLATVINQAWLDKPTNVRVRLTLLSIIEIAKIEACSDIAFQVAIDSQVFGDERLAGLAALIATNDPRIASITNDIVTNSVQWTSDMAAHALNLLFPKHCKVDQFNQSITWIADSNNIQVTRYPLQWAVSRANLTRNELKTLRDHLVELVSEDIKWNKRPPRVTSKRPALATLLASVCQKALKKYVSDDWLRAALLSIHLFDRQSGHEQTVISLRNQLKKSEHYEKLRLLEVKILFALSTHCELFYTCDQLFFREETFSFDAKRDLGWVKKGLVDPNFNLFERDKLLDCIIYLFNLNSLPVSVLLEIQQIVFGQQSLVKKVEEALSSQSPTVNAGQLAKMRKGEKRHPNSKAFESWKNFYDEIESDLEEAFSPENEKFTAFNLWKAMVADSTENEVTCWNRRFIEEIFDKETADKLRLSLMKYWRSQNPYLPSERSESERQSFPNSWLLGLAGIHAEAEDENWVSKLSDDEARLAVRYSLVAYTSIPSWLNTIAERYPDVILKLIGREVSFELEYPFKHSYLLQEIGHADSRVASLFVSQLLDWLSKLNFLKERKLKLKITWHIVLQVAKIIVKYGSTDDLDQLVEISDGLLDKNIGKNFESVVLWTLFKISPEYGLGALERKLEDVKVTKRSKGVFYFAKVFGDSFEPIDLHHPRFTPLILKTLLSLAFSHVKTKDDVHRHGLYSPDVRDDAQTARRNILLAFNNAKGDQAYRVKLKARENQLFRVDQSQRRSYIEPVRLPERAETFTVEKDVAEFIRTSEVPPKSNEAMFLLLKERINDIREILKRDLSPRRIWSTLNHENLLRTAIALEFDRQSGSTYSVTQEDQTAEEKRTDIRLRSKHSDHEAVIELKRFERNTPVELKTALSEQLVEKYLKPEKRRAGILLITLTDELKEGVGKDENSNTAKARHNLKLEKLIDQIEMKISDIKEKFKGELFLGVELLDLRVPTD